MGSFTALGMYCKSAQLPRGAIPFVSLNLTRAHSYFLFRDFCASTAALRYLIAPYFSRQMHLRFSTQSISLLASLSARMKIPLADNHRLRINDRFRRKFVHVSSYIANASLSFAEQTLERRLVSSRQRNTLSYREKRSTRDFPIYNYATHKYT